MSSLQEVDFDIISGFGIPGFCQKINVFLGEMLNELKSWLLLWNLPDATKSSKPVANYTLVKIVGASFQM